MKRIFDLSKAELVALTTEEVNRYIDVECAIESIPLLPAKPVEPSIVKPSPDTTIYTIGDFNFLDVSQAQAVVDLIQTLDPYATEYVGTSTFGYALTIKEKDKSHLAIGSSSVYAQDYWNEVKDQVAAHAKSKKEYDDAQSEYKSIEKERKEIEDRVWERVNDAQAEASRIKSLKEKFERYIDLADGDKHMAWKFLTNADPGALVRADEIFPEHDEPKDANASA